MKTLIIAFISILSVVFCSQQKPLDIICDIETEDFAIKKWKSSHSKYNNLIPGYVVKYDTLEIRDSDNAESSLCNLELHFVPDFFEADKFYYNPNCLFSIVVGKNEFMFSNVLNEYSITENTLSHIFLKELYAKAMHEMTGIGKWEDYLFWAYEGLGISPFSFMTNEELTQVNNNWNNISEEVNNVYKC